MDYTEKDNNEKDNCKKNKDGLSFHDYVYVNAKDYHEEWDYNYDYASDCNDR